MLFSIKMNLPIKKIEVFLKDLQIALFLSWKMQGLENLM